jgi:sulfate permease, SulP family
VVLLVTFGLTVVFDLTIAIEVGVVLAALLFMHRMSEVVTLQGHRPLLESEHDDLNQPATPDQRDVLPDGVAAFRISGPLFFAVANRLDKVLDQYPQRPRVFILRMREVPLIDASGATALSQFLARCRRQGTGLILSGVPKQPRAVLDGMGLPAEAGFLGYASDFPSALRLARDKA